MPKITLMPSGINGGIAGSNGGKAGVRSVCNGWSAGAARRNSRFLMSVDCDSLGYAAFCFTFTVKLLPQDHKEWASLIDRLRKAMSRRGVIRDHWVTEWTKAGRPHLHGVCFYDPATTSPFIAGELREHWLGMTGHLETQPQAQHVALVESLQGWLAYVAKHAGRGFAHYQRERKTLPEGWQQTGRMWGKGGDWPTVETSFEMDRAEWYALRRMVRRYLIAQTRFHLSRSRNPERIAAFRKTLHFLKRLHTRDSKTKGQVQGIQEWAPQPVTRRMIALLQEQGGWVVEAPQSPPERPSALLGRLRAYPSPLPAQSASLDA